MKTILLLVFLATSTSVVKAEWVDPPSEADRLAKYQAMVNQQYNTAMQELQPSPIGNLPIGTALSVGALTYSLQAQGANSYNPTLGAIGAASSLVPRFSGWTASSALRSLGWR